MPDEYTSTPLDHVTDDGGYSYQRYESCGSPDGTMAMRTVGLETEPGRLKRLQNIWITYQQKLGETVFSA